MCTNTTARDCTDITSGRRRYWPGPMCHQRPHTPAVNIHEHTYTTSTDCTNMTSGRRRYWLGPMCHQRPHTPAVNIHVHTYTTSTDCTDMTSGRRRYWLGPMCHQRPHTPAVNIHVHIYTTVAFNVCPFTSKWHLTVDAAMLIKEQRDVNPVTGVSVACLYGQHALYITLVVVTMQWWWTRVDVKSSRFSSGWLKSIHKGC